MRGLHFLVILVIVTAVDLLVPYFFIGGIGSLGASYLFWTLLTLIVIVFAVVYTSQWGRRS
ncbi:MAG: hypothetical protein K9K62_05330 [Desulfobacteraceae bacterium]|nr:hypothetical protein [Desulfobacteraceae bacterium]